MITKVREKLLMELNASNVQIFSRKGKSNFLISYVLTFNTMS